MMINDDLENYGFCIKNDEFCVKNDDLNANVKARAAGVTVFY